MKLFHRLRGYLLAVTVCTVAVAVGTRLEAHSSCMALAVLVSSLYGGRGPGLLAVVLCAVAFDYYVLPPLYNLGVEPETAFRYLAFIAISLSINWLIGAKRRSDASRLKADEQQRIIAETVPDAIISFDPGQQILFANAAAGKVFGWPPAELTGIPLSSLLPDFRPDEFPAAIELTALRNDGTRFDAEAFFGRAKAGDLTFFTGCIRDITERKRTSDALRTSEHNLRLLIEAIPGLVCLNSAEGNLQYVNQRVVDYTGRTVEELTSHAWKEVIHPDHVDQLSVAWADVVRTGGSLDIEYRLRRADGEYRWFQNRTEPLRDAGGRVLSWYGLLFDIDERKVAEEALRASERDLALLIETIPALVWCAAPSGALDYVNERVLNFTGSNMEALAQQGWMDFLHPDDVEHTMRAWLDAVETGRQHDVQYRMRRYDGVYRWFHVLGQPLCDPEGRILRWYGLLIDIDDRKNMEEALRTAQTRLSRATQIATVGELAASVAHEINQPLAAVVTNGHACFQWLAANPPNLANARIAVERIIRDGNGAAQVVQRIRALFKRAEPEKALLDLNEVIGEVLRLLHGEILKRRIVVETGLAHGLPRVAGDRLQLQQVLFNLLLNGIEAMDEVEGRPRRLSVTSRRQDSHAIRIEVRDRGAGFADPEKIFEAFFTTKTNGMGMGLSICRSIIEAHRGRLWAEPAESGGAVFLFTLPLPPARPAESEASK